MDGAPERLPSLKREKRRFPAGMTNKTKATQIPCGNDKQKRGFPARITNKSSAMTSKRAKRILDEELG
jgi:hypothetical protein